MWWARAKKGIGCLSSFIFWPDWHCLIQFVYLLLILFIDFVYFFVYCFVYVLLFSYDGRVPRRASVACQLVFSDLQWHCLITSFYLCNYLKNKISIIKKNKSGKAFSLKGCARKILETYLGQFDDSLMTLVISWWLLAILYFLTRLTFQRQMLWIKYSIVYYVH